MYIAEPTNDVGSETRLLVILKLLNRLQPVTVRTRPTYSHFYKLYYTGHSFGSTFKLNMYYFITLTFIVCLCHRLINASFSHIYNILSHLQYSIAHTAVSRKVVQLKSIKAYATIPKRMMGCGCSLLHRQVHEFSAQWKAVL